MKKYGPTTHCAIDTVFVATLLSAPKLFGLKGAARTLCHAFGVAAAGLVAFTNQPLSVKRIIPARVHGKIDTPFVPHCCYCPTSQEHLKSATRACFSSLSFSWCSPTTY